MSDPPVDCAVSDGVLRVRRPDAEWLSTGWDGGRSRADAAYNVTVPEGFDRTDLGAYVARRRAAAGFDAPGPALLTGVSQAHARGAHLGPVAAVATAGVSNPAALPVPPAGGSLADSTADGDAGDDTPSRPTGTVNVVVVAARALDEGALASLLAGAAEAKAATLLAATGFPGTTTDAVVVGTDPAAERARFAGSATTVGAAARACVREAVRASLAARYAEAPPPESVTGARYGVSTDARAAVFRPM